MTRVDSHGSNDLTDNGGIDAVSAKIGNGAGFISSSSEYLNHADNADLSINGSAFSISFWIKGNGETPSGCIISKGWAETPDGNSEYMIEANSTIIFRIRQSNGNVSSRAGSASLDSSNWQFVVCVYDPDANQIRVSINGGGFDATAIDTGSPIPDGNGDFTVGQITSWSEAPNALTGIVDEISFWKGRVLNSSEAAELNNSGDGIAYEDYGDEATFVQLRGVSFSTSFVQGRMIGSATLRGRSESNSRDQGRLAGVAVMRGRSESNSRDQGRVTGVAAARGRSESATNDQGRMAAAANLRGRSESASESRGRLTAIGTMRGRSESASNDQWRMTAIAAMKGRSESVSRSECRMAAIAICFGSDFSITSDTGAMRAIASLRCQSHATSNDTGRLTGIALMRGRSESASHSYAAGTGVLIIPGPYNCEAIGLHQPGSFMICTHQPGSVAVGLHEAGSVLTLLHAPGSAAVGLSQAGG